MTTLTNTFGIAARNFTAYPEMPNAKGLVEYGVRIEELGYDSIWVWDHIAARRRAELPDHRFADRADRRSPRAPSGSSSAPAFSCCRCAIRSRSQSSLSSMDQLSEGRLLMGMAAGWYKREFDAVGVPFEQARQDHGREPRNPEAVLDGGAGRTGDVAPTTRFPRASCIRSPCQKPRLPILIGGYVDVVLKRAARRRRLAHLFLPAEDFTKSWEKVRNFAKEAGKDPDKLHERLAAADHGRHVTGGGRRPT